MTYIGVDYGSKRVGIAYSDEAGTLAFPHSVVATDDAPKAVHQLASSRNAKTIVMGDSRDLSGAANPIQKKTEKFAEQMRSFGYEIKFIDERFTSVQAGRAVAKEHVDAAAASIILQSYLDSLKNK